MTAKQKIHSSIDTMDDKTAEIAYDILERIAVAFDHDYTFVTRAELENIEQGREEITRGEYISLEDLPD